MRRASSAATVRLYGTVCFVVALNTSIDVPRASTGTYLVVIEGTSFSANPKVYLTATDDDTPRLLTNCPERGHRTVACETTAVSGDVVIVVGDSIYSNTAYYDSSEPMVDRKSTRLNHSH